MKKSVISVIICVLFCSALCSCSIQKTADMGTNIGRIQDLAECYGCFNSNFPVEYICFKKDGTCVVGMGLTYNGKYQNNGDHYLITLENGENPGTDMLAKELNEKIKITATNDKWDRLCVHITSKDGNTYLGDESEVFYVDGES